MPKLAELTPCVAQCAACGRYWELRAMWVPFERLNARQPMNEEECDGD